MGAGYTGGPTAQQIRYREAQKTLTNFLNPPRPAGMPDYAYNAIKADRAKMWEAFVKNNK